MRHSKPKIPEFEKIIINSRKDKNYLKCHKVSLVLLKIDKKNNIAKDYQKKLKKIDLDDEAEKWHKQYLIDAEKHDCTIQQNNSGRPIGNFLKKFMPNTFGKI